MLVLSRRPNEKILFPSLGITVEIAALSKSVARVGIDAPAEVAVVRGEIATESDRLAARDRKSADHRLRNRLHTATLAIHLAQKQLRAGLAADARETLDDALREYAELDREAAAEKAAPKSPRGLRALLVEDNRNESELLAEFLRLHGIDVELADDGQVALDYLRTHERPDVILLDMRMPRFDGPATLASIRGNSAYDGTKVFAVSGSGPDEFAPAVGGRGFDGWFTKPVNPAKLVDMMNGIHGALALH